MARAYLVGDIDVRDRDLYADYASGVPATLKPYGGRYVVRGGAPESAEGDWRAGRIVVLEVPDRERARAGLEGPGDAPHRAKRLRAGTPRLGLVGGGG